MIMRNTSLPAVRRIRPGAPAGRGGAVKPPQNAGPMPVNGAAGRGGTTAGEGLAGKDAMPGGQDR